MTRAELIGLLVDATPDVPATDDPDLLCQTAAKMLDARDKILAAVPALDGKLDQVQLAVLERLDAAWSAALASHHDRVGQLRAASAKVRAYSRQIPRR